MSFRFALCDNIGIGKFWGAIGIFGLLCDIAAIELLHAAYGQIESIATHRHTHHRCSTLYWCII